MSQGLKELTPRTKTWVSTVSPRPQAGRAATALGRGGSRHVSYCLCGNPRGPRVRNSPPQDAGLTQRVAIWPGGAPSTSRDAGSGPHPLAGEAGCRKQPTAPRTAPTAGRAEPKPQQFGRRSGNPDDRTLRTPWPQQLEVGTPPGPPRHTTRPSRGFALWDSVPRCPVLGGQRCGPKDASDSLCTKRALQGHRAVPRDPAPEPWVPGAPHAPSEHRPSRALSGPDAGSGHPGRK